jgi:hypothetical protein
MENICAKFSVYSKAIRQKRFLKSPEIATTAYNNEWVLVSFLLLYF